MTDRLWEYLENEFKPATADCIEIETEQGIFRIEPIYCDDDEVWAILDSRIKPLTKEKKLDILESMITLSCELNGQFTLAELGYALLKSDLLTYQQENDLIETLGL